MASRRTRAQMVAFTVVVGLLLLACSGSAGSTSAASGAAATQPGWQDELTGAPDKLDVATTVAPISSIARNIGGDRIRLHGLIPDATNSHTFEPSPSDAKILAQGGPHPRQRPPPGAADAGPRGGIQVGPRRSSSILGDNTITQADWLFDFSFPGVGGRPQPAPVDERPVRAALRAS